jgi:predicted PurR-regulated permease PerM
MNMAASRQGILMNAKMKMLMGLLLLTLAVETTGCSVLLYEDRYDHSGEIVLIPVEDIDPPIIVCPGPHIPPPPPKVEEWALIGTPIARLWEQASHGLEPLIVQFSPQIHGFAGWLVSASVSTGLAVLQALLSIIIAGVLLAASTEATRTATTIATRLAGTQGQDYTGMASATVRSVAVGIIGVAIIQAALIGLGLVVFSVPHAGLWTLLCLLLAVLQISPMLIMLPVIIYMFYNSPTGVAVTFMIWEILASGSDNVLKPILLARGVKVPMIVIFMGVIGGFISAGFIGLFVGAVVLSMGYELFRVWMQGTEPDEAAELEGNA